MSSSPYPWAEAALRAWPRFLARVRIEREERSPGLGPCWTWLGGQTRGGGKGKEQQPYGTFWVGGFSVRVHIFVCVIVGKMVPGHHVDHECLNTLCVNPHHLDVVTPTVNSLRMWETKRKKNAETCCLLHQGERDTAAQTG